MKAEQQIPGNRSARPGDVFLLLVPTAQELHRIRAHQKTLIARYGGKLVDFVHITCERFSPNEDEENFCINYIKNNLSSLSSFMIYAERLVQFFAPYWGEEVLRWQVLETEPYSQLRDLLAGSLNQTGCASHFIRHKPTTCTALRLYEHINMDEEEDQGSYPMPLFEARQLWVSKLVRENEFTILEKFKINPSEKST